MLAAMMVSSWVCDEALAGSAFLSHSSIRVATARGAHVVAIARSLPSPWGRDCSSRLQIFSRAVAASSARGGKTEPRQLWK